ncbi:MAG: MFS transporter [Bacteroidetes bacterium]|nr:MFS transporter [Bacteroidota bacterium]
MLKLQKLNLNPLEKRTFKIHTVYSLIEAVILGVLALNEFVFLKSLFGSNYQLGFLFQFSAVVFVFLLFINEFIRRIRDRKRLLIFTGLITRLPLFLLILFPHSAASFQGNSIYHYVFLAIFLVYFLGNPIIFPNINYLLKANYSNANFAHLYSISTSLNKIVMLIVTLVYGLWLDADNYIFIYVFPVMAILGVGSIYLLTKMHFPEEKPLTIRKTFFQSVFQSGKNMYCILKENVAYRHFEIGFMLYGFAFMFTMPILFIYFYDELNLNYFSVAFYRNAYNIIAIIILPYFGKLMGKTDPRIFGILTYASLGLYILFLGLTSYLPFYTDFMSIRLYYSLIGYVVFHGVFAASMVLLWNIGSSYFCSAEEAGTYQSLHLSLVGIRAIFAPLFGIFFYELFGFNATFGLSIIFVILSIYVMIWSHRRIPISTNTTEKAENC